MKRRMVFNMAWWLVHVALLASIFLAVYSTIWEYSTERYLKGFSDAIVPASAAPEEKARAILEWMGHGPARHTSSSMDEFSRRDPEDTLNYNSLLSVCGTATNAFVNLANSSGLHTRRLLLLDSRGRAKHVVAEVLLDGRWAVVDPAFRAMLRDVQGHFLTKEELKEPRVFEVAVRQISDYDRSYTFESTAHVRLTRIPVAGALLAYVLNHLAPDWEDSSRITLLTERISLEALVFSLFLFAGLFLVRAILSWYGERRLGVSRTRLRTQLYRSYVTFVNGDR